MGETQQSERRPSRRRSPRLRLADRLDGRRVLGRLRGKFHYVVLIGAVSIATFPLLLVVLASVKTRPDLARGPLALPSEWVWSNFVEAWTQARFSRFFFNSVVVAVVVVLAASVLSVLAGYAFGRLQFPFQRSLSLLFLLGLLAPPEAFIIPLWNNLRAVGLIDTYWALILPQTALSLSFGIFWMGSYFSELPREVFDAAKIDGAGNWNLLWRVAVPISRPAIVVMIVLFFVWTWNDFLIPLVLVSSNELRTLPVGLAFLQGKYSADIPLISAAATIVAVPTIVVFFAFQRHFVRGITGGSVDG